jgi:hypothetical protein
MAGGDGVVTTIAPVQPGRAQPGAPGVQPGGVVVVASGSSPASVLVLLLFAGANASTMDTP